MSARSWLDKLTSPEARAMLRTPPHFVLDFVGDDRPTPEGENASNASDAARVVSAVAATASVAERLVSAATRASSSRKSGGRGGKIALGIAVGAAVAGGIVWIASPK